MDNLQRDRETIQRMRGRVREGERERERVKERERERERESLVKMNICLSYHKLEVTCTFTCLYQHKLCNTLLEHVL